MRVLVAALALAMTAAAPPQLLPRKVVEVFRRSMPVVDDAQTARLLRSPDLVFYTDDVMPPAYQNDATWHDPFYNISGTLDIFGNGNREFPWSAPGGVHLAPERVNVFRFFKLPRKSSGEFWPVVYWKDPSLPRYFVNEPVPWRWRFPDGTVFGELLGIRHVNGYTYPFELRLRIREADQWAVDVYRPFPTAADLAAAIRRFRPDWESSPRLRELMQELQHPTRLTWEHLVDRGGKAFDRRRLAHTLPPIGNDDLAAQLLSYTTWKSALGAVWADTPQGRVSAPTVEDSRWLHIVPPRYTAFAFDVDRRDCMECHKHTNKAVNFFDTSRDWYGRIRGSDGIFSFYPWDPKVVSHNGFTIPLRERPQFRRAGMVAPYDPGRHPASVYPGLDPEFYREGF